MNRRSPEWEKVGMLLERHAHLNQLRVGTVQVYLVVVAAVLALWGGTDAVAEPDSFAIPLGLCLIGVGLLAYIYDLRLRARTFAVAVEVARSAPDRGSTPAKVKPKIFDEDLAFSAILMLVNSTLVYIGLEHWFKLSESGGALPLAAAALFFVLQFSFYCWHWPRLAAHLSAWPDSFAQADRPGSETQKRDS